MRIYIAGSFQAQRRLRPIRDKLWQMGHEVISSWLDECAMPPSMTKDEFYKQLAVKDLTEVRAADCIILDTFDVSTTGGRMVEWGYALGHPKLKYVIGSSDCLFLELADRRFASWEDLFTYFDKKHSVPKFVALGMEGKQFT